jgi:hypothetical protein
MKTSDVSGQKTARVNIDEASNEKPAGTRRVPATHSSHRQKLLTRCASSAAVTAGEGLSVRGQVLVTPLRFRV